MYMLSLSYHNIHAHDQQNKTSLIPRPTQLQYANCKQSKTGAGKGLGMRLERDQRNKWKLSLIPSSRTQTHRERLSNADCQPNIGPLISDHWAPTTSPHNHMKSTVNRNALVKHLAACKAQYEAGFTITSFSGSLCVFVLMVKRKDIKFEKSLGSEVFISIVAQVSCSIWSHQWLLVASNNFPLVVFHRNVMTAKISKLWSLSIA